MNVCLANSMYFEIQ